MIVIMIFGAAVGLLLGLRSKVLALIPAELLIAASAVSYGLVTHQSVSALVMGLLTALVVPQIGFALVLYLRKRAIKPTSALLRAAQMAIGQEMAKLLFPQEMPAHLLSLLGRLEKQQGMSVG